VTLDDDGKLPLAETFTVVLGIIHLSWQVSAPP